MVSFLPSFRCCGNTGRNSQTLKPSNSQTFKLNIRVPGWCVGRPVPSDLYEQVVPGTLDDFRVTVNGAAVKVVPVKGYCVIDREWKTGELFRLFLLNLPEGIAAVSWEIDNLPYAADTFFFEKAGSYKISATLTYADGSKEVLTKILEVKNAS